MWFLTLEAPIPQNCQTQLIRRQELTNCLSGFDHFVELTLKRVKKLKLKPCPFQANVPFLHPLTMSRSQLFYLGYVLYFNLNT